MPVATVESSDLRRTSNLLRNLKRIFAPGSRFIKAQVARDAGIHVVHLNRLLSGNSQNPTLTTVEALSIALEIPLETLVAYNPSDLDLRISKKTARAS